LASPDFAVFLLIGLATWTLVEYAVHRLVYHHAPVFSARYTILTTERLTNSSACRRSY
jgi:hypothetical protein